MEPVTSFLNKSSEILNIGKEIYSIYIEEKEKRHVIRMRVFDLVNDAIRRMKVLSNKIFEMPEKKQYAYVSDVLSIIKEEGLRKETKTFVNEVNRTLEEFKLLSPLRKTSYDPDSPLGACIKFYKMLEELTKCCDDTECSDKLIAFINDLDDVVEKANSLMPLNVVISDDEDDDVLMV